MNKYLDYGGFLVVLYTLLYAANLGKEPSWFSLYFGAAALIAIGIVIEIHKKVNSNE